MESSYRLPLSSALGEVGIDAEIDLINGFSESPLFTESWSEVLESEIQEHGNDAFYLFSAHSLPTMRNPEISYRDAFFKSADNLARELGMKHYAPGFQSRGRYGSTWLEPSVYDVFAERRGEMGNELVAIPLGFVYDHLEILYDLDYEFGGKVRDSGKDYYRTGLPNDSESFVECLADCVMSYSNDGRPNH